MHLHELKVCPVIMTVPRRHVSNRGNVTSWEEKDLVIMLLFSWFSLDRAVLDMEKIKIPVPKMEVKPWQFISWSLYWSSLSNWYICCSFYMCRQLRKIKTFVLKFYHMEVFLCMWMVWMKIEKNILYIVGYSSTSVTVLCCFPVRI